MLMAKKTKNIKPFDEQNTKHAKGKKVALIRRIEDMKNLSESEITDAIRIIDKTSTSKGNRQRRMNNLLNDVTGI
tara:strand:- start:4007 stop:4231 length:225 start_codon:yes stop_codon:yes gene_type:complete